MQTLKTTAIVVLVMTVMYTAYMSLTTPPDTLPPEVEKIVLDEGGFEIESGLPESLESLGIENGSMAEEALAFAPSLNPNAQSTAEPTFGASFDDSGQNSNSWDNAVSMQISDAEDSSNLVVRQPGSSVSNSGTRSMELGPNTFDAGRSDMGPTEASLASANSTQKGNSAPASRLDIAPPKVAPLASNNGAIDYPTTDLTFQLPDPNSLSSDVSLKEGESFGSRSAQAAIESVADASATSGDSANETSKSNVGLANALSLADEQYQMDQRREALETLSLFYNSPSLTTKQREELLSRLDPLAAEVIYSRRHLIEQPHRVGQRETLMQVAVKYDVPWQLLANINGIEDPITVLPGTELKVVRGPFRAEVNLSNQELTLFLGDLYAGRFPIATGTDPPPKPGSFTIQDKQSERTYYGATGSPVPPENPENPYGNLWLDLGSQLCIHGSPYSTRPSPQGCISVAADYADDLYGILTQGSSVTILR